MRFCLIHSFAILLVATAAHGAEVPTVKHIVNMEYPPLMRTAGIEGTIEATGIIKPDGSVERVEYPGDHNFAFPLLEIATTENLLKWRFSECPAGECRVTITYVFVFKGTCTTICGATTFEVDLPDNKVTLTTARMIFREKMLAPQ